MKNIKNFKISPFHIIIFISILAIIIFTIIQLTDKSNFLHIDLNNENLIKTDSGYIEELVLETEVLDKSVHIRTGRLNRGEKEYNIKYYNEELKEEMYVSVAKSKYDSINIGDKIKVVRTVYYSNSGLRLYYIDDVFKLQ